jgi:hypothetical protein
VKKAWSKSRVAGVELRVVALVAFARLAWLTLRGSVNFSELAATGAAAVLIAALVGQLLRWSLRSGGQFEDHMVPDARGVSEEDGRVIMLTGVAIAVALVVIRNVAGGTADFPGTIWTQGLLSVGVLGRLGLLFRTAKSAVKSTGSSSTDF